MKAKKPADSFTVMNELVLPNDTNILSNLMGGRLLHLMDIAAAMAATKHSHRIVVTASVDNVSFQHPIRLGDIVHIEAKVTRAFNSSMEVHLEVHAENPAQGKMLKSNEAFYTFVAVDQTGRPIAVPPVEPETEAEKKLFEGAMRRRQVRLVLGGKMAPKDAVELKNFLIEESSRSSS